jgi:GAF domain-containing protein
MNKTANDSAQNTATKLAQREAELAVINSVQKALAAQKGMQEIYDLVGRRIQELFDAQAVIIATFDHESDLEHFQYNYEDGARIYPDPRPIDNVRRKLIKTKDLILIDENLAQEAAKLLGKTPKAVPGTELPKSVLFVPMIVGDTARGYVSLQNLDREHAFSDSDVRLLSTLANSMSAALENARLFNETEQRNAELAVINSVQQGLVAEMDMQGIYDLVGDRLRELFDAQVVVIRTYDHEAGLEQYRYVIEKDERIYADSRSIDGFGRHLIEKREPVMINENYAKYLRQYSERMAVEGEAPQSVIFVPLIVGDEVKGNVSLQNVDREHAFTDSDLRLLSTLANSMSVALENARLFAETTRLLEETEQRNAELAVINSVQEGLVREMDMQAIYDLVGKRISDVLNTQSLLIRTFDHENGLENWEYVIENGERLYSEPRPFIWANKRLIETKEPLVINENYEETAQKYGGRGVSKGLPPKSAVFVPMMVGDEVIGSVSSQNVEEEHAFSESDVRLLTTLTNSMSVAIDNARLFSETTRLLNETEQQAAELQTVNNISRALVSQLEFDALVDLVGEQMRKTFKADIVYLALHEQETDMLHFPYYFGDASESKPFGNGITEKIILNKEPLLINHDMDKAYDRIEAEKRGKMVESYLGVPIMAGNKAMGVISVQSTEQENRFDEYDQRLLSTIAANVAVAMQNAEAYENLQEALTELKSAQQQLVQQEKLASLGQLTAGIAHEIKNPLNFVNNFSEVSIELVEEAREELSAFGSQLSDVKSQRSKVEGQGSRSSDPSTDGEEPGDVKGPAKNPDIEYTLTILDDIKANLKKIHEHGSRADGIVRSMLLHSRGKSGERIPTDLNKLIDEYVKLAYHGMRATNKSFNIDIQTDYDESIEEMDLVAQDLSRAFLNIINNGMYAAFEYSKETESREPVISITTKDTGTDIEVRIRDNGPGIPHEIREKIFDPFFTTKPTGEGTGLGLSMTYDVINLHKGTLQVKTEPGAFTEFIITLPKN